MASIDFAELKRKVTLEEVIHLLGIFLTCGNGHRLGGPCPLDCCKDKRVCRYNLGTHLWYCHHCRRGGDQLRLYEAVKRLNPFDAARQICNLLNRPVPYKARSREHREHGRGIPPETLAEEEEDVVE